MPGLRLHLTIADALANELGIERINDERGAYYLGATTPDIRVLTRWDRERTHFFALNNFEAQSGVHRLFDEEPHLRDAAAVTTPTAAFMAGYISHLIMDEDYITQIYRPLFGEQSALKDDATAGVMDKILQWDIERAGWEDCAKVEAIRQALVESAVEVNIEFIARETLLQWRDVSLDVIAQPPSVERLVHFLGRRMPELRVHEEEHAARLTGEVPGVLRRTWDHVGKGRIDDYLQTARTRSLAAIREYLS